MKIVLQGGFGEKGRTSIGIEWAGTRLVFDVGIKVGAEGTEYFPQLAWPAATIDHVFVSHAHEDHVGALGWMVEQGFGGSVHMTPETWRETASTVMQYAGPGHAALLQQLDLALFETGRSIDLGDISVATGRSGHVAGGTWFALHAEGRTVVYSGDVVPGSSVFAMDALPEADLLFLDGSYGGDEGSAIPPAVAIANWVEAHPGPALLPTPLSGRSLELIAALAGPIAIDETMLPGLLAQLEARSAFRPGVAAMLGERIEQATVTRGAVLPELPLLCHDGMGTSGPSTRLLPLAAERSVPILLSGHLPEGSPAAHLHAEGRADWIRMPTHPNASQNAELWEACGRPRLLAHSCATSALAGLARGLPSLDVGARTGGALILEQIS